MNEIRKMYMDAWNTIAEATYQIVDRNIQLQMDIPSDNELHYSGMAANKLYEAQKYLVAALSVRAGLSDDEIRNILKIETALS